jgi:hypothetical protein
MKENMNTTRLKMLAMITALALGVEFGVLAQGTVTFNQPWAVNGIGYFSLAYFDGFSVRMEPYPPLPHDDISHVGVGLAGHPNNATPHIEFGNTLGIPQAAIFAWTNAASLGQSFLNGTLFGLVSVDLANPVVSSLTPIPITFNGYRADGSMVTQTFTTSGSGFQTYAFNSTFATGLVRVEMPSDAWAMDNLVFVPVPEPSSLALAGLGALTLLAWRARHFRR